MKKMFNEGNQIHNFMSSSGSGTVINYGSGSGSDFLTSYGSGYGSGSTSQKFTVPTVPVPVPVPQHWLSRLWEERVWGSRLYPSPTLLVLKSLKTTLKDCFFKVCDLIRGREGCGGPASTRVLCFLY